MSQIAIADLNFLELVRPEDHQIEGGLSTAAATALDTRIVTGQKITGNLKDGFKINVFALGSAASAAAAAASVTGNASAEASADAG